jgi:hypothetical protein
MVLCFHGCIFTCPYFLLFPSIQKTFIHKLHRLFPSFYVSCIILLICVSYSLVTLVLCFTFLGYFRIVIFSFFFLQLVGRHLRSSMF